MLQRLSDAVGVWDADVVLLVLLKLLHVLHEILTLPGAGLQGLIVWIVGAA